MELNELPEEILLIGGGYIAFEFAAISSMAGAKVQILQSDERALKKFDPDLVNMLIKNCEESGINVKVNSKVTKVGKKDNAYLVYAEVEGIVRTFTADLVIHTAGRVPDMDELDLKAANIERDEKGIVVNDYLQSTTNADVYSAGDSASVKGGLPLTPVAGKQASIVIKNLLEGNTLKANFDAVPTVVFSLPPLASIGLTEEQANKKRVKFKKNFQDTSSWYSSRRIGMKNTGFKILIEEKTGKIIGAHILGPNSDETINLFSLAMKSGLTADDIKKAVFTYPTSSYDVQSMV
jgi:glutathione reductase (NADPH)